MADKKDETIHQFGRSFLLPYEIQRLRNYYGFLEIEDDKPKVKKLCKKIMINIKINIKKERI